MESQATPQMTPGYEGNKEDLLKRLRRIEGQVRGLHRMIESDTYCVDVLTQISAVDKALERVAVSMVHDHMSHCMVQAASLEGEARAAKIAEVTHVVSRLIK